MNTIFIGGSRHVTRLPPDALQRLDNVISSDHKVILGDANGADKAVQKYFSNKNYRNVIVYCSGDKPRNNLGEWEARVVEAPPNAKGFQFYAAKDRQMAQDANFGLMIWDGKSPGTLLNVLRLSMAGKIAVLFNVPARDVFNIKTLTQCSDFIKDCDRLVREDLMTRATTEEWDALDPKSQPSLLSSLHESTTARPTATDIEAPVAVSEPALRELNKALASGNVSTIVEVILGLAPSTSASELSADWSASTSVDRSSKPSENLEFSAILASLSKLGLRLEVKPNAKPEASRIAS